MTSSSLTVGKLNWSRETAVLLPKAAKGTCRPIYLICKGTEPRKSPGHLEMEANGVTSKADVPRAAPPHGEQAFRRPFSCPCAQFHFANCWLTRQAIQLGYTPGLRRWINHVVFNGDSADMKCQTLEIRAFVKERFQPLLFMHGLRGPTASPLQKRASSSQPSPIAASAIKMLTWPRERSGLSPQLLEGKLGVSCLIKVFASVSWVREIIII